jgi:hypothetical protein
MAHTDSIEHFEVVHPEREWASGIEGYFLRLRGIASWIAGNFGVSIWATLQHHWLAGCTAGAVGLIGALFLLAIRRERVAGLAEDSKLHEFAHVLRDEMSHLLAGRPDLDARQTLSRVFDIFAQRIADYYKVRLLDDQVTCAIRICCDGEDGSQAYYTFGRSTGGHSNRPSFSEPIPADKGLPNKLMSKGFAGVFLISSVPKAVAKGDYHETPNDRYGDCTSMMVAPINNCDGAKKVMVGMVSISHPTEGRFRPVDTVPLKAFADILGLVTPIIIHRIHSKQHYQTASSLSGHHLKSLPVKSR